MSSKPSFTSFVERDQELRNLKTRHAENAANIVAKENELAELNRRINEGANVDVRRLADAIVAGNNGFSAMPIAAMRDEYAQQEAHLAALRLAGEKLGKLVAARLAVIAEQYIPVRIDEQHARAHRIVDSLLTIAEANAEERRFRVELEADGFAAHRFSVVQYPVNKGPFGGWMSDALHLPELVKRYGDRIGYEASSEQRRRLDALGN
ncbi:MAG: hypothetical protein A3F73_01240 [Gallionellales bacterium RIFCSPLOWO2_12_FULL_59_22]|nr:MAG: hypothetical protein A3F73_01240 [Gallionellales bacterium RIFCSPLOWO2_12_FULL_59_22]